MTNSLLVLAVVLIGLLIVYAQRKRVEAREARAGVARPGTGPGLQPAGEPGPDRGMSDPLLRRLYMLLYEITQVSPEVARPEHLMALPGYREAVQLLADANVPGELLLGL